MHRVIRAFILMILCCALAHSTASAGQNELRLGIISDKPIEMIQHYIPLVNYVTARLKDFGISGGKIVVARDTGEMMERIRRKEVDIVFESAFPTIEMREKTGIKPRLIVWRKGVREYRTVFFVRRESPIRSLNDLAGKTIVFEDATSTSSYAIPKAELKLKGLHVAPAGKNGPATVSYVFAGEELNQVFLVLQKKADAGAFNTNDWNELSEKVKSELKVIHETKPVLRYIASFHPALPGKVKNSIERILTQMDKDDAGQDALKQASNTKKIERMTDSDYQSLAYVQELTRHIDR